MRGKIKKSTKSNLYIADKIQLHQYTSIDVSIDLGKLSATTENENELITYPYQAAVGSLIYMLHTRPDIAYAVGIASRFMSNYNDQHVKMVKRIFRYLNGNSKLALVYDCNKEMEMHAYVDANFYSKDEGKSITGYVIKIVNGPISWCSRKQETVALSSTEAEYIALATATQEILRLKAFINELGMEIKTVAIYEDNQSTMRLAKKYGSKQVHSAHLHRMAFVREKLSNSDKSIVYCPSNKSETSET